MLARGDPIKNHCEISGLDIRYIDPIEIPDLSENTSFVSSVWKSDRLDSSETKAQSRPSTRRIKSSFSSAWAQTRSDGANSTGTLLPGRGIRFPPCMRLSFVCSK